MTARTRVLTGITTTGTLHLGNYVGAVRPCVEASREPGVDSFFFMADYHALIKCDDPARIAQLRKQIADKKAETAKVESANNSLKQAIKVAESLSTTLSEEQKKYTAADPKTGKPAEPLAKNKIEELSAEVQKLSKDAAALTAKPAK